MFRNATSESLIMEMSTVVVLHQLVSWLLLAVAVTALVLAVSCFAMAIAGWKTPNRNLRLKRSLVCLLVVPLCPALLYLYTWGVTVPAERRMIQGMRDRAQRERLDETSLARMGDQAPDFEVTDADGAHFSLSSKRGKLVLLNFFATWCGPCLQELPHLQELWEQHGSDDRFDMIVIGREETMAAVQDFRDSRGFTFPAAPDPDRAIYDKFATEGIPRTLLVAPDGQVIFISLGFYESDISQIEQIIRENQLAPRSASTGVAPEPRHPPAAPHPAIVTPLTTTGVPRASPFPLVGF